MITKEKISVKVGKYVNTEYVDAVLREYKKTRWVQNSEKIDKPDTLSVWFSLEDIEGFLNNAKANGGDGIKFYFAAYPKAYAPEPEHEGRQSIVLVATKSRQSETGSVAHKDLYITRQGKSTVMALNKGIIFPPGINVPSEGGMGDLGITIVDKGEKGMEII
jgi:hypothetical protein